MNPLYNIAIRLYSTAVKLASLRNNKAKLMIAGQGETFDTLARNIEPGKRYIWIHVSSLGEFEQGRPLIEMLKQHNPERRILLTFFSPSGYEVCKNYNLADVICYLPFDLPGNVRRFLDAVDVETAIFVKYEFWGNYLSELHRRNIPTYIISAIFRPTQAFFKPWGGTFRKMLGCYTTLFVQDEESRALLEGVGVTNVVVAGDTRFDRVTDILDNKIDLPVVETFSRGQFTLFAGSSWQPDEEFIIPYFNSHPEMKMVIAPHEISPERIAGIKEKITRPVALYTESTPESAAEADCLIIDCFGILSKSYRFATVAYVGGGFGVGIHNINEAAVYGIPVVFGPKYHKFKEARDLISIEGAFTINGGDEFAAVMDRLLGDGDYLRKHGETAGNYIKSNLGATKKIYSAVFCKQ
ncbi:MAG: glycosyltransferase N-terminal domain-containing protein [Bacteroidales bacterium]|nr:glycosyltransferase N-terminal domain-containing protein [Bacteroidales bacterium]MDD6668732.1 glycosyltransferase N-terminal domain-containing protein [Bacteroidales bacterium]